jgi:hypothetical protein
MIHKDKSKVLQKSQKIIKDNLLTNFTDLIKYGISHYQIYKKFKLHKEESLIELIEENDKKSKLQLKKDLTPQLPDIIKKVKKIFTDKSKQINSKGKETEYYTNFTVTEMGDLAVMLELTKKEFYALELNKNLTVILGLERMRNNYVKNAKQKLWNNSDTSAAIIQLKIAGGDETREKLSTNYNKNENENKTDSKIQIEIIGEDVEI